MSADPRELAELAALWARISRAGLHTDAVMRAFAAGYLVGCRDTLRPARRGRPRPAMAQPALRLRS